MDASTSERNATYRELVRCATLAASSHNSQPWRFALGSDSVIIRPDFARRCPVVDPADHHLYTSLGCAAENLLVAAVAHGLHGELHFDDTRQLLEVKLAAHPLEASVLYQALPHRQCSRSEYDARAIPAKQLDELVRAATGSGVEVTLLTTKQHRAIVEDFVRHGNEAQFADRAWLKELETWMRFNAGEAQRLRDGLYSKSVGAPSMPNWLAGSLFTRVASASMQNKLDLPRVRGASALVLFSSAVSTNAQWIELGRCYERFALLATALGIRNAFLNQPLEVATLREQFGTALGLGTKRPDLLVRIGYGEAMPSSYRRHVDEVID